MQGSGSSNMVIGNHNIRVIKKVGEGGYSFVFLAEDQQNPSIKYALKRCVAADTDSCANIEEEIRVMRLLSSLNHPNLIKYYAHSTKQGNQGNREYYILTEFCSGGSLIGEIQTCLDRGVLFSEQRMVKVLHHVFSALDAMHTAFLNTEGPISHRDIKLENVLIDSKGNYKLCDFGSTSTMNKIIESNQERQKEEYIIEKRSTEMYRAPELCDLYRAKNNAWPIGPKVDVWAVGNILYTLAYHTHPFEDGGHMAILSGRIRFPDLATETRFNVYSKFVNYFISKCFTMNPNKRGDCKAMMHILQCWGTFLSTKNHSDPEIAKELSTWVPRVITDANFNVTTETLSNSNTRGLSQKRNVDLQQELRRLEHEALQKISSEQGKSNPNMGAPARGTPTRGRPVQQRLPNPAVTKVQPQMVVTSDSNMQQNNINKNNFQAEWGSDAFDVTFSDDEPQSQSQQPQKLSQQQYRRGANTNLGHSTPQYGLTVPKLQPPSSHRQTSGNISSVGTPQHNNRSQANDSMDFGDIHTFLAETPIHQSTSTQSPSHFPQPSQQNTNTHSQPQTTNNNALDDWGDFTQFDFFNQDQISSLQQKPSYNSQNGQNNQHGVHSTSISRSNSNMNVVINGDMFNSFDDFLSPNASINTTTSMHNNTTPQNKFDAFTQLSQSASQNVTPAPSQSPFDQLYNTPQQYPGQYQQPPPNVYFNPPPPPPQQQQQPPQPPPNVYFNSPPPPQQQQPPQPPPQHPQRPTSHQQQVQHPDFFNF